MRIVEPHRAEYYKQYYLKNKKHLTIQHDKYKKERYGITIAQYYSMLNSQMGQCIICEKNKPLVLDHCHVTKRARKFLCNSCNSALGLFGDSISILSKAIEYLKLHKKYSIECKKAFIMGIKPKSINME